MPIYNYSCPQCDYNDSIYLYMNQRNVKRVCPNCQTVLQKDIGSGKLFNLKGKGWTKEGLQ